MSIRKLAAEKINLHLKSESVDHDSLQFLFSMKHDLPDGVSFFEQRVMDPKWWETLSYLFFVIFLLSSIMAGTNSAPMDAQLGLILGTAFCIPPIVMDRIRLRRFKKRKERWGFLITENHLIYRIPGTELRLKRQAVVEINRRLVSGKTGSSYRLSITYRKAGHLPLNVFWIDNYFSDDGMADLKTRIDNWLADHQPIVKENKGEQENKAEKEAWELKLRDIYAYRAWLPGKVIDAIPNFPCSLEERMRFLDILKPHENRMRTADIWRRTVLLVFGTVNLGVIFHTLFFALQNLPGFPNLPLLLSFFLNSLLLVVGPIAFYITCLHSWWKARKAALLANIGFSVYAVLFYVLGLALMMKA